MPLRSTRSQKTIFNSMARPGGISKYKERIDRRLICRNIHLNSLTLSKMVAFKNVTALKLGNAAFRFTFSAETRFLRTLYYFRKYVLWAAYKLLPFSTNIKIFIVVSFIFNCFFLFVEYASKPEEARLACEFTM